MNTFGKDRMAQILIQSLKIVNNSITGKYIILLRKSKTKYVIKLHLGEDHT